MILQDALEIIDEMIYELRCAQAGYCGALASFNPGELKESEARHEAKMIRYMNLRDDILRRTIT
jgi:hypothetical protein